MRMVVVSLGCVMLLAGCGAEPDRPPSLTPVASATPTPVHSPTPTPTPTPSPTSFPSYPADLPTQDPEIAAIIAGWQEYWRVYEKFAADPLTLTDLTETQYVTTGRQASIVHTSIASYREKRLRGDGGRVFRDVVVGNITKVGSARQATITYCADGAQLRVFDIDTNTLLPRSGTYRETAIMEEGPDGLWRVELLENVEAQC